MNEIKMIVGLGASAGGLEALESFFKHVPSKTGMAFIVVVHLDPGHSSILPELLQRLVDIKVVKIADGDTIQPDTIYVIPPKYYLSVLNGQFQLFDLPPSPVKNLPIDFFLTSLAQDQGERALAIILSGTGSDGSLGLKNIKAEGGLVMVQDEQSAKYDGMPRNAIATGMADFVLNPNKMPEKLLQLINNSPIYDSLLNKKTDDFKQTLQKILVLIRNQTGHDFSLYKKNTLLRRIERRMSVHQILEFEKYLHLLQNNEQEIAVLFKELLIGVTSFYRDPEAFDSLDKQILPEIIKDKPDDYTLRIWVCGCSTGEEAYSIAICAQECLLRLNRNLKIQVFGTDIDEQAIDFARKGLYPVNSLNDINKDYLQRYFIDEEGEYRVKKSIRSSLVFAPQNLIKDPPFTKLDLICCRNLLIYFTAELQKKVFPIFHYSLNENGILFLGSSESTGQGEQFFDAVNKKWKIYRRISFKETTMSQLTLSGVNYEKPANKENNSPAAPSNEEKNMLQVVESMLKHCSVASCVVIDADKNILYLHGRLGRYLDPAEGHFKSNLLEMARSERLRNVLINSLHQAETSKQKIQQNGISIETEGHKTLLDISVIPLPNLAAYKHAMLVIFEPTPAVVHKQAAPAVTHQAVNNDVFSLQKQLDDTRNDLQMTIKDLETSNEELKSSNEELQSTNEELQSTNEELETSKEELQSLNEESTTVNAELQSRIDELSQTNDDIKNLLNSTQIATLFLDTDLKIRRFTPQMTRIISLMPADINRPIEHFSSCLDNVRLTVHAEHVLKTLEKIEMEVNDDQGQYYKMRVLPYRTSNNVIDGVVISFEDVSLLKSVEISLRKSEQRYKSLFDDCPVAVIEVNYASLLHYISSKELKDSKSISHFLENNPNAQNEILDQIKVLNLNKAAMVLFESNNKKTLLPKIPQFIARQDDYLLQLLTMIMEKKQHGITNTVINSVSDVKLSCTITTTIPSLEHELNYHNCIMTLVKRE